MDEKTRGSLSEHGFSANHSSRQSASIGSGSRVAKSREFWNLLAKLESLAALEASLTGEQADHFDRIQDEKASALAKLQILGRSLGLDRSNRDLRVRLEALELAETRNLVNISTILEGIGAELRESVASQRNLHSLRGAYSADSPGGAFFAEG